MTDPSSPAHEPAKDPVQEPSPDSVHDPVEPEPVQVAQIETVEAVVRHQLAKALGGRRGMAEAAVPTILFTLAWLGFRDLRIALLLSVGAALVLLVVRLAQRSTLQFVLNALFGIGLGWFFVYRAAAAGGSAEDQALAYFLPGILYNAGYAAVLSLTCLVGWPLVGFMVGSITGDATAWHEDRDVVRLTSRLTWLLVLPCVVRVALQAPVWLAGSSGTMDPNAAVATLGILKIVLGWPLQLAALGSMVWLLARNQTPASPHGTTA